MPKLTKTAVDNLAPPAKGDAWLWCSELPGFGVRAQAGGRKTYVVRYRTHDGTQRKQVVARVCDMPPEKARSLARDIFADVAAGKDPVQERAEAKNAPTLADLRERFMAEHSRVFKKPNSQRSDESNWDNHVLPILGASKKVRDIDEADILKLKAKLSDKRATANQCIALMSKAMNLCEVWKLRPRNTNPCRGIQKFDAVEKELILTPEQMSALNSTLLKMTVTGDIKGDFADFIRLLMLTGCRKTEIMHARAEWIDLHQGLLLLPDSKTGQRRIPLVGEAHTIAAELVADGREWLIPGQRKGKPLQTPYKVWKAVKIAAGIPLALRLHDLRHTAGSWAHMHGATQKEIQQMLGHSQMSTTERYIHAPAGAHAKTVTVLGNVITGAWGQQPKAA